MPVGLSPTYQSSANASLQYSDMVGWPLAAHEVPLGSYMCLSCTTPRVMQHSCLTGLAWEQRDAAVLWRYKSPSLAA
jgi:hypothetical protein